MLCRQVRSVEIRQMNDADIPLLHEWRNSADFRTLCSTRRNKVSADEFLEELRRDTDKDQRFQCMILRRGKAVGTIYAYHPNMTDGHAFVTTFVDGQARKSGVGPIALVLFSLHLFRAYAFYKLYMEVYSYNDSSLKNLRKAGIFKEEGIFKGHRLIGQERYDLVRLALFRESMPRLEAFIESLRPRPRR